MKQFFTLPILFFFFVACSNNKAEKVTAVAPSSPPLYFFYPKANMYFDTVNKNFVFLGNDGRTWQTGKEIPAAMQAIMDKRVVIDSPAQPVWKDNENHKLIYSALLYASPTDTQEVKKVVVPPPVTVEKKKERKGLGKFFDKIFGKKKKEGQ